MSNICQISKRLDAGYLACHAQYPEGSLSKAFLAASFVAGSQGRQCYAGDLNSNVPSPPCQDSGMLLYGMMAARSQ